MVIGSSPIRPTNQSLRNAISRIDDHLIFLQTSSLAGYRFCMKPSCRHVSRISDCMALPDSAVLKRGEGKTEDARRLLRRLANPASWESNVDGQKRASRAISMVQ